MKLFKPFSYNYNLPPRVFMCIACALIAACSVVGILPRLALEKENRSVAIIVDYRDIIPLAEEAGVPNAEALSFLRGKGVSGLMVNEFISGDAEYAIPPDFTGPDFGGLKDGTESGLNIFYRIAPAQTWQLRDSLEQLKRILTEYPRIILAAPSGEVAAGYPDMKPLASLLKEHSVSAAQIEFSRQLGAPQLDWLAFPNIVPLHSVTNKELTARRISRQTLHERLVRAAVERSVRALVLRPAVSGNMESSLEAFGQEVENLAEDLKARGLEIGWPVSLFKERPMWRMSFISALACSLVFVLSAARYAKRLNGLDKDPVSMAGAAAEALLACAIALGAWKVPALARLLGAFTAAFAVTETSLLAMDDTKHRARPLLEGFLFALAGGLAVAALFSQPVYMFRLMSFSGVKLTLMLPPVLVVLHDMRRRIHPESVTEMLSRPPIWGELVLGVTLLALLGLILFRSDNVQFIPGIETKIRNALERLLIARPRSREVFIGYPSVLLYAFAVNRGLWARYREIFRVGAVLGFSSVVNSFCHYHTPFMFILLREFHGLWVGAALGVVTVLAVKYIALPLWSRVKFIVE